MLFRSTVVGLIGDCYVELGESQKATRFFIKAAESKNEVLAPFYLKKAAVILESTGETEKALKNYLAIKDMYPLSLEGQDIDKYIARLQ